VEERPFRAASEQEDSRALAPVPSDLDVFHACARAGQRLAEIHVHCEQQPEYPLTKTEKAGEKLDYRVTKMRLSKDKTSLIYNQFLTLSGIPPDTYEYRLGNRSALEWVIDQYQVSTDKRSGITNDPNREDDPQYILRLVGQVITVSLETVKIVGSLAAARIASRREKSHFTRQLILASNLEIASGITKTASAPTLTYLVLNIRGTSEKEGSNRKGQPASCPCSANH